MNVYLMSTVELNLLKFHISTNMLGPRHTVVGWHLPEKYTDKMCIKNMLMRN